MRLSLFIFPLLECLPVMANFYGSMSDYACNNNNLYQSCGCQSFCQPYMKQNSDYDHHSDCRVCDSEELENEEEYGNPGCGCQTRRKHRRRKNKKKKKFKFSSEELASIESIEEEEEEKQKNRKSEKHKNSHKKDWDDESKWESKFVAQTTPKPASSGLSGLGLGNGGLFGISSGVGVGVPGVGPIGVGSGLGIG